MRGVGKIIKGNRIDSFMVSMKKRELICEICGQLYERELYDDSWKDIVKRRKRMHEKAPYHSGVCDRCHSSYENELKHKELIKKLTIIKKEIQVTSYFNYKDVAKILNLDLEDLYNILLDLAIKYKMRVDKDLFTLYFNDQTINDFIQEFSDILTKKINSH